MKSQQLTISRRADLQQARAYPITRWRLLRLIVPSKLCHLPDLTADGAPMARKPSVKAEKCSLLSGKMSMAQTAQFERREGLIGWCGN